MKNRRGKNFSKSFSKTYCKTEVLRKNIFWASYNFLVSKNWFEIFGIFAEEGVGVFRGQIRQHPALPKMIQNFMSIRLFPFSVLGALNLSETLRIGFYGN